MIVCGLQNRFDASRPFTHSPLWMQSINNGLPEDKQSRGSTSSYAASFRPIPKMGTGLAYSP